MTRIARALLTGAVSLLAVVSYGGAFAQETAGDEDLQVRIGCDLLPTGRTANCAILSRRGADEGFDGAALQAADTARVWPVLPDLTPRRIHFPILFRVRSGPALERVSPGMGLLRVRLPGEPDRPDDRRARIPATPPGDHGQAWAGLGCVVSETRDLKTCWPDNYDSPPGLLAGELIYYSPARTLAGETIELPDALPAPLEVVRQSWTPAGTMDGYDYFVREISRSGDVVLVWSVESETGGLTSYWITELDCAGQRARPLLRLIAEDGRPHYAWHPDDWFPATEEIASGELTPFTAICKA